MNFVRLTRFLLNVLLVLSRFTLQNTNEKNDFNHIVFGKNVLLGFDNLVKLLIFVTFFSLQNSYKKGPSYLGPLLSTIRSFGQTQILQGG